MKTTESKQDKPEESGLSQERRDEYNRRRRELYKQRKNERKEEKETNTFTERRLHFIRVVMQQRRISQTDMAEKLGITRQAVNWMFTVTDDMHLTMIKRILSICQCTCSVEMVPEEEEKIQKKATFEFKGSFTPEGTSWNAVPAEFIKYPESIENCPPDANLRFLADFIMSTQMNVTQFSNKTKISRQNLAYAFKIDDIRLSTLCQIANYLNAKLVWEINDTSKDKTAVTDLLHQNT